MAIKIKKKKTTATKKQKKERGSFSFNYGTELKWFRDQAKRLGMSCTSLIKVAVREYANNHPEDIDE